MRRNLAWLGVGLALCLVACTPAGHRIQPVRPAR